MKFLISTFLLIFILLGCNKIPIETYGLDYSEYSDNIQIEIKDNRTFSAILEISLADLDLPSKDIDYELIFEISEFDNADYLEGTNNLSTGITTLDVPESAFRSKKTIYPLGDYKNEKVSYEDEIEVATNGKSIVHEAQILLKTLDGKLAYLLEEFAWESRSLTEKSDAWVSNSKSFLSGILIYPNVFYLTYNQNSKSRSSKPNINILTGEAAGSIPATLLDLNIRGVIYDDELGTVYNNSDNQVRYYNKSNNQNKFIAELDNFYCSVRTSEAFYFLEQDEKLYKFNISTGSRTFVKNVNLTSINGEIYPISNYSSLSQTGGSVGHYDLVFFNNHSYLIKGIENETKVYIYNDTSLDWDILQNNQTLTENSLDEAYFIQSANGLYIISSSNNGSKTKIFEVSGLILKYLGETDISSDEIVRGKGLSGTTESFSLSVNGWGGLIKI